MLCIATWSYRVRTGPTSVAQVSGLWPHRGFYKVFRCFLFCLFTEKSLAQHKYNQSKCLHGADVHW